MKILYELSRLALPLNRLANKDLQKMKQLIKRMTPLELVLLRILFDLYSRNQIIIKDMDVLNLVVLDITVDNIRSIFNNRYDAHLNDVYDTFSELFL